MSEVTITRNRIPQVIAAIHAGTVAGVRAATKQVHDGYQAQVAVRTGATKSAAYTVTSEASTYRDAVAAAHDADETRHMLPEVEHPESDTEGIVADAAVNAIYLEMGTSRMAAQPAMHPALAAVRGKLPEIIAAELNKAIAQATR